MVGVSAVGEETGVGRAGLIIVRLIVATVRGAVALDGLVDGREGRGGRWFCQGRETPRETTEMHEIEFVDHGEFGLEEGGEAFLRQRHLQGGEGVDCEAGVIEIGNPFAIPEAPIFILLRTHVALDQITSLVSENGSREARDLQHL